MRELHNLKPAHIVALRLIAVGLPVHEAAQAIGISSTFMSTVKNSRQGREYLAELNALADDYAAQIVALGLSTTLIRGAKGCLVGSQSTFRQAV